MIRILYVILLKFLVYNTFAQAPAIQWQKCLGGSDDDVASCIQQTTDGGYIVAGSSFSYDGDVTGHYLGGYTDVWIVKLSSTGILQWQKTLGGTGFDNASSIQQTTDGGYIMAGSSTSIDGDVTGNHGNNDYWIVKLSSTGTLQWQESFGGSRNDNAYSTQQTTDGGYIVAGTSYSNNGDVTGHYGTTTFPDYWIVKLSSTGTLQWQKSLGGTSADFGLSIQQTTDSGYIVAGSSASTDGVVTGNHGSSDYWIVKLSSTGTQQWQKCLGGNSIDEASSIQQTTDGGYIVAGYSFSNNGDVTGNHGSSDYWIIKLNSIGTIQWQKCFGGTGVDDRPSSIQQTTDGGYIVAGFSSSNDGDITGNHGYDDYWIVKLDSTGILQWQISLGSTYSDKARFIQQTMDDGYIVAGFTSFNDGDVTGNHGNSDFWVVKLGTLLLPITLSSFTATNKGNYNLIQWSTVFEDTGESFEVQYSTDAIHFHTIAVFKANGVPSDYQYIDKQTLTNKNYYRLYIPYNTFGEQYSKIVLLELHKEQNITINAFPNPALTYLYLSEKLKNLIIYNLNGQLQINAIETDNVNIQSLNNGYYILKGINMQDEIVEIKFLK